MTNCEGTEFLSSWHNLPLRRYALGMQTEDEWTRVGATIRALRRLAGVSQHALAEQIEISSSHLSNIESGRRACPPLLGRRIAEVFAVDPKAIMTAAATAVDPSRRAINLRTVTTTRRPSPRLRPFNRK